jgi:hypothetical protein
MRERFNVETWDANMRAAIERRDGDRLADLMYQNDRNGCFSYDDVCREFGEMTREQWLAGTIDCAVGMLNY